MHDESPQPLVPMIEALLFEKGDGYSVSELSRILSRDSDEVEEALSDLKEALAEGNRGVRLVREEGGERVLLVTTKEAAGTIEHVRKEALSSPLSPAALETLTIVLYLGPIEKKYVDYIRGVNSQGILRTLRARDLVARKDDGGVVHYTGTLSLYRFLGLEKPEDLPDYESARAQFQAYLEADAEE